MKFRQGTGIRGKGWPHAVSLAALQPPPGSASGTCLAECLGATPQLHASVASTCRGRGAPAAAGLAPARCAAPAEAPAPAGQRPSSPAPEQSRSCLQSVPPARSQVGRVAGAQALAWRRAHVCPGSRVAGAITRASCSAFELRLGNERGSRCSGASSTAGRGTRAQQAQRPPAGRRLKRRCR